VGALVTAVSCALVCGGGGGEPVPKCENAPPIACRAGGTTCAVQNETGGEEGGEEEVDDGVGEDGGDGGSGGSGAGGGSVVAMVLAGGVGVAEEECWVGAVGGIAKVAVVCCEALLRKPRPFPGCSLCSPWKTNLDCDRGRGRKFK